jgi:modulator of FtsH protease HflC
VILALLTAYGALFTVYQTKQALLVRLGEPVRVITEPGLHVKYPLIDTVITVDNRILDLENAAQEVFASDQRRLVIDAFARYRIIDVLRFYQTVTDIEGANLRLSSLLNAALRRVLGEATLIHVVRDDRATLMARVRDQLDREARAFGIEVVDVGIRRADLPGQNSQAVYQRMQTERQRQAASIRGEGNQKSQEIRAKADRDVTVIVAEAQSHAEQIRGDGDAERNRIFGSSRKPMAGTPISSPFTVPCKPMRLGCVPTTRGSYCGRIPISSSISAIRPVRKCPKTRRSQLLHSLLLQPSGNWNPSSACGEVVGRAHLRVSYSRESALLGKKYVPQGKTPQNPAARYRGDPLWATSRDRSLSHRRQGACSQ